MANLNGVKTIKVNDLELETFTALQSMTQRVTNPLKNWLLPTGLLKNILSKSKSPLIAESRKRPGGWRAMEIIYRNDPPLDFIDKMAVTFSPFAVDIRNRRRVVTDRLSKLIVHHSKEVAEPLIVGIGGGPGRNMLESMDKVSEVKCKGVVIDLDSGAFDYGDNLQKELGLEGRVNYIQGDARDIRKVVDHNPDIVNIVGLFDYLDDNHAEELITVMYEALTPGGSLLATSIHDAHNNGPFLARAWNWDLNFRCGHTLSKLIEKGGFELVELFDTPLGIYTVITARKTGQ